MPAVSISPSFHVKAPKDVLSELTRTLHSEAAKADWPEEVYSLMRVIVDDDKVLKISYPHQIRAEVRDLEYGTDTEPPRPLLRRVKGPFSAMVEKAYVREASKGLL